MARCAMTLAKTIDGRRVRRRVTWRMKEVRDETSNEPTRQNSASLGDSKPCVRPPASKAATQAIVFVYCAAGIAAISSTSFRLIMKSLWRFGGQHFSLQIRPKIEIIAMGRILGVGSRFCS